jgi:hypothetical protein
MKRYIAILISLFMIFSPLAGFVFAAGDNTQANSENGIFINLKAATFDPILSDPNIPFDLRYEKENGYYLVQFKGPINEEWIFEIIDSGAIILGYIPQYTYIVHMDGKQKERLEMSSHTRWIGNYHPAYKIEENLLISQKTVSVNVMVFELGLGNGNLNQVRKKIETLGGTVLKEEMEADNLIVKIDASRIPEIAFIPEVEWIDEYSEPVSLMDNIRVFTGAESPLHEYGFNGTDIVGEVKDNGIDEDHSEFEKTLIDTDGNVNEESHGSSTFGIVFAEGKTPRATGMMPNGQGVFCDWGVGRILSIQNLVNNWGGLFQSNSWSTGSSDSSYTSVSQQNDQAIFEYDVSMLYASGNGGGDGQITRDATAKNVITVGALNHYNNLDRTDDQHTGSQGNKGPTDDGRIKPDLVGPYDSIYTTSSGGGYTSGFGGTSGATPIVAGGAGLVYDMYIKNHFGNNPSQETPKPATVKAIMIADAYQYEFSQGDRMAQGWGLVDVGNTYLIGENHLIDDESKSLRTGESETYTIKPTGIHTLKISLVWTDVPGTTSSSQHLINNLDLLVRDPDGISYRGNFGLDTEKWSQNGGTHDTLNNVENVFIENPKSGEWTIEVIAENIALDGNTNTIPIDQKYALVGSGVIRADHDMVVSEIEELPRYFMLHNEATVNGTISNIGLNDETNVVVNLLEDGNIVGTQNVAYIQSGTSLDVSLSWYPNQEKTSDITIEVVPVSGENRLFNNKKIDSVDLFTPLGLVLVDEGHGNVVNFDAFYEHMYSLKYPATFVDTAITSSLLNRYNVFVCAGADSDYTPAELTAIQSYVEGGGGLFVIGDNSASISNSLTDYGGITWVTPRGIGGNLEDINPHNITDGVSQLNMASPLLVLEVNLPAEEIVYDNDLVMTRPLVAASEYVNGRIVALSDDNCIDDGNLDSADNRLFGENVIKWLNNNLPPIAIIDSPGDGAVFSSASTIYFDATSSYDPDGYVATYIWSSDIDGILETQVSFSRQLTQGDHIINLAVSDDKGRMAQTSISLTISQPLPPSVSINSPSNNEKINDVTIISGSASDIDGFVDLVEIKIGDDVWISAQGTSMWNYDWDTTLYSDGQYVISARSYDNENQISDIATISVFTDNTPPNILSGPNVDNITHQKATITWETDEEGDCIVEYGTDSSYGYTETKNLFVKEHEIKLRNLKPDTTYHFRVITKDELGNIQITSQDRTFKTEPAPDITPPEVAISSHQTNDMLKGKERIEVDASDDSGISHVDFYVDDEFKFTDSNSPFSWEWNTASGEYPDGRYTIKVVAIDNKGNEESYEIKIELDNEKVPPSVVKRKATPNSIFNGESNTVLFIVKLDDPEDAAESVTIDLSSVGGSSDKRMYNDGTHGDETANDDTYSLEATIPSDVDPGEKLLTVTVSYFGGGTIEDEVKVFVFASETSDPSEESESSSILPILWILLLVGVVILVIVLASIGRRRKQPQTYEFTQIPAAQQVYQAEVVFYPDQSTYYQQNYQR